MSIESLGQTLFIRSYNKQVTGHSHPYGQITIPLMGSIDMIMNREPLTVTYGEAIYVPKYTYHQFQAKEEFRFLVVNLVQNQNFQCTPKFSSFDKTNLNSNLHFTLDEKTLLFTSFIEKQLTSSGNVNIENLMFSLLNELISTLQTNQRIDHRIITAINVINKYISAPHTIASLANVACLSESQFKVLFKKQFGCTPHEYITEQRMQSAIGLLLNTDLPLTLIAEKCGYKSLSVFIRRFSQTYKHTPHKIRTRQVALNSTESNLKPLLLLKE